MATMEIRYLHDHTVLTSAPCAWCGRAVEVSANFNRRTLRIVHPEPRCPEATQLESAPESVPEEVKALMRVEVVGSAVVLDFFERAQIIAAPSRRGRRASSPRAAVRTAPTPS